MTGFSAFSTASLRLANMSNLGIVHLQQKFRCTLKAGWTSDSAFANIVPDRGGPTLYVTRLGLPRRGLLLSRNYNRAN